MYIKNTNTEIDFRNKRAHSTLYNNSAMNTQQNAVGSNTLSFNLHTNATSTMNSNTPVYPPPNKIRNPYHKPPQMFYPPPISTENAAISSNTRTSETAVSMRPTYVSTQNYLNKSYPNYGNKNNAHSYMKTNQQPPLRAIKALSTTAVPQIKIGSISKPVTATQLPQKHTAPSYTSFQNPPGSSNTSNIPTLNNNNGNAGTFTNFLGSKQIQSADPSVPSNATHETKFKHTRPVVVQNSSQYQYTNRVNSMITTSTPNATQSVLPKRNIMPQLTAKKRLDVNSDVTNKLELLSNATLTYMKINPITNASNSVKKNLKPSLQISSNSNNIPESKTSRSSMTSVGYPNQIKNIPSNQSSNTQIMKHKQPILFQNSYSASTPVSGFNPIAVSQPKVLLNAQINQSETSNESVPTTPSLKIPKMPQPMLPINNQIKKASKQEFNEIKTPDTLLSVSKSNIHESQHHQHVSNSTKLTNTPSFSTSTESLPITPSLKIPQVSQPMPRTSTPMKVAPEEEFKQIKIPNIQKKDLSTFKNDASITTIPSYLHQHMNPPNSRVSFAGAASTLPPPSTSHDTSLSARAVISTSNNEKQT